MRHAVAIALFFAIWFGVWSAAWLAGVHLFRTELQHSLVDSSAALLARSWRIDHWVLGGLAEGEEPGL